MRCAMVLTGMGQPVLCGLPPDLATCELAGSVAVVWENGGESVRLIVTPDQLSALCDQVIEYALPQEDAPNGTQPTDN